MKNLLIISLFLLSSIWGYTQKIVPLSNPLEKILQNDFDSTIIYSIQSNWDNSPNYLIVSKKSNKIYFYRYSINRKTYLGRDFSPMKSELSKKLIHFVTDFKLTKPDINSFFKWIDTKYADSSIWKEIIKYEPWSLIDDRNIKIESNKQFDIYDGVHLEFKLITKDKIVQLKYYEPEFYNEHNFNQSRASIIKIEKIIRGFYENIENQSLF